LDNRRIENAKAFLRTDQGPEFTGKELERWACEHGVHLKLIQPGKPTQNSFVERFNSLSTQRIEQNGCRT